MFTKRKESLINELNTTIEKVNELNQPALNTLVNTATKQAQLQLLNNIDISKKECIMNWVTLKSAHDAIFNL